MSFTCYLNIIWHDRYYFISSIGLPENLEYKR